MKTNKLMTAFALSAMFAACTQDAELNETLAKNDFSNIPMVEANFTVNAGVESRMASEWGWQLNDKVGFAWLGAAGMDINGSAYQNNPLYCIDEDGAFKAEGMFYVGKYFAYMPYNAGNHTIEQVGFKLSGLPLTANRAELAKHAIYISPKVYELEKKSSNAADNDKDKLASGIGENLPLNIAQVTNAATINLTFANTNNITDLKVYSVSLDAKNGTNSLLPKSFTYKAIDPVYAGPNNKYDTWKDCTATAFYTNVTATGYGAIVAENEEGISATNNALTVYMLTMRGNGPAADAFEVTIETNYGKVTVDLDDVVGTTTTKCIAFTEKVNNEVKDKTIATTSLFNNFGSAGTINVYVDMAKAVVANDAVKTQAELMEKLNMLETSGYSSPIEYTLNPETAATPAAAFTLADFTLPANLKALVTLKAGDKTNGTIEFTGNTVINKQIVVDVPSTVKGTMTVENIEKDNAQKITLNAGPMTIANEAVLVNNGKIQTNITIAKATTGTNAKGAGKYISNGEKAKLIVGGIINEGEVEWIAGELPSITGEGLVYTEVADFAEMLVVDDAVTTYRFVNDVDFNNAGQNITINNVKTIEVCANVTMNINKPSIGPNVASVTFTALENIDVKAGKSFSIVSNYVELNDDNEIEKANILKFSTSLVEIKVAANATLNLEKVHVNNNAATIEYAGTVNLDTVKFQQAPTWIALAGGVKTDK